MPAFCPNSTDDIDRHKQPDLIGEAELIQHDAEMCMDFDEKQGIAFRVNDLGSPHHPDADEIISSPDT